MKFYLSLFFLFLSLIALPQGDNLNWVLTKLYQNSPSLYEMLIRYDNLPQSMSYKINNSTITTSKSMPTYKYVETDNKKNALESMSTNIHEAGHMYGHQIYYLLNNNTSNNEDFGAIFANVDQGFYLGPNEEYWVSIPKTYIFPSSELVAQIPQNLRTFRFDTYINGTSSTQSHGIVGLMDEFHAYYLGSQCNFDLLPAYKELDPSYFLSTWIGNSKSEITAYYEFDFFIKEYLLYAMKNRPATYNYLKNDSKFVFIYNEIRNKYGALIAAYEKTIKLNTKSGVYKSVDNFYEPDYSVLIQQLKLPIYNQIKVDFNLK